MKKICMLLSCFLLLISFNLPIQAVTVSAQYACVMEMQTGQILYEKNAHEQHSMASTTKIMTALVALERGNLSDTVVVSENAAGTEGTSLYLQAGDKVTLSDLLYGLMLQSGNDAAIAIAEHISGSVEQFAQEMTRRAKEIGAKNTAFQNPNGLDAEGHYTTAYDLALITREALQNDTFAEIVSTKSKQICSGTQTVTNHNKLLSRYEGCIGVKTGYTKKTGRCLVSSAVRDGRQVICVTLNAPDDWNDHTALLDFAFANTVRFPLLAEGMIVNTLTVRKGTADSVELLAKDSFYLTERPDTKFQNTNIRLKIPDTLTAPISYGEVLGTAEIYHRDELLAVVDLIAGADVAYSDGADHGLFRIFFQKLLFYSCTESQNGI